MNRLCTLYPAAAKLDHHDAIDVLHPVAGGNYMAAALAGAFIKLGDNLSLCTALQTA